MRQKAGKQELLKGVRVGLVAAALLVLCHLLSMALPLPWDAPVACRAAAPKMYFISLKMILAPLSMIF